jgi:hypothetical protein
MKNVYKILVRMPDAKRPHGRPRDRWKDDTRMDLMQMTWESIAWQQAQGGTGPSGSIKGREFLN